MVALSCAAGCAPKTADISTHSPGSAAVQGNGDSHSYSISADARYVAFESDATNLVAGDTNGSWDVFVRDLHTGQTTRASVSSTGEEGNSRSACPVISADGRYVAFASEASNLVAGDTNGIADIFVHDLQTGHTSRVSVDSAGTQGNGLSQYPSISADGRHVAFSSIASNLVPADTNGTFDIFVHDCTGGQTTRVSVGPAGIQGNGTSYFASISADGLRVAFDSGASNLVAGDTNGRDDIFVHDLQTNQTVRASVDTAGIQGNGHSYYPAISADGRHVAFSSFASTLVPGDTNGAWDVFSHDLVTGQTLRVSVDSAGIQGYGDSSAYDPPSISADGRYVAFWSHAQNLVSGDTNGANDVFVHDMMTGQTTRVSVDSGGTQGNSSSYAPAISADGRCVAYDSGSTNLVPEDANGFFDVFMRDRQIGETMLVSVDSGVESDVHDGDPSLPSHERRVVVGREVLETERAHGDSGTTHGGRLHDQPPLSPEPTNRTSGARESPSLYTELLESIDERSASWITPYCFGDLDGTACPCGNRGAAGNGCANSVNPAGANLAASGTPSVSTDTLVLRGDGMPDSTALYFQATSRIDVAFGDGKLCAAGVIVRLGTKTNSSGASQYPGRADPSLSARGLDSAGDVREYQAWYRNGDPTFCSPSTFNLTNAVQIRWQR